MSTIYCTKCGEANEMGAAACKKCGTALMIPRGEENPPKTKKLGAGAWAGIGCGGLILIFIIIGMIGASVSPKPNPGLAPAPEASAPAQSTAEPAEPQAIAVTAESISDQYRANELAADKKYKDKQVRVTGIVESVGKDITGTSYISFEPGLSCQAMFEDEHN
ncbi:MAG TPA: hypothetical protein VGK34_00060, partial [Armatimonadota bacterium]